MGKNHKIPKFGANPTPAKKPVFTEPKYDDGHPLAWRFCKADKGGPYRWSALTVDKFYEVLGKLTDFETMEWSDITRGGSHPIAISKLCRDAQERLIQLKYDDFDELVSLRITGPNRVWCIKTGHLMRVLWWDAEHQVYPILVDKADREKLRRRRG